MAPYFWQPLGPRSALIAAFVLCGVPGWAQSAALDSALDHTILIHRIHHAKDLLYQEALRNYDAYLSAHPGDVRVHLERCAFIGEALYEENDEYNPNEAAHDSCLSALGAAFPREPEVLLVRAEHLWGEDKIALLDQAEALADADTVGWTRERRATLYRGLAGAHQFAENGERAVYYIQRACMISEEDRGSMLRANILADEGLTDEALEALNLRTDTNEGSWGLRSRASLLLELNDHANALRLYRLVEQMDSSAIDEGELALTLEGAGQQAMARQYFVKDTIGQWNAEGASLALFEHDLRHHAADTALASYNAFRDHGFAQDPLALERITLFLHHPLLGWKWRDLGGLLLLGLIVLVLCMIPYMWVLPIHFIGRRWPRFNGTALPGMDWGLKHFWWVSAAYLLATLGALAACPPCVRSYFTESWSSDAITTAQEARVILVFTALCALLTLPVLFRTGLAVLRSTQWSFGRTLGQVVVYFLLFRVVGGIYIRLASILFDVDMTTILGSLGGPLGITRSEVQAFVETYGAGTVYLMLALVVPVYEEVLFRGVILNSCARYIGFARANVLQALLFGAVHGDLLLLPYFFGFGMLTGLLVKRAGGLLGGILFHAINNLLAVSVLIGLHR